MPLLGIVGLVLLAAWVLARAFTDLGSMAHLLLLSGLMLLLIAVVKSRDARPGSGAP